MHAAPMRIVRHRDHHLLQRVIRMSDGNFVAAVHHFANRQPQAAPQMSAWMEAPEIFHAEIARAHQRHSQRMAQRERHGGAGGGREIVRIGFALNRCIQHHVHFRRQRSRRIAENADALRRQCARNGISCSSSKVLPLLETIKVGSPGEYKPRSPCEASAACRKTAGVPVLHSVETILRATWPDLPRPVTTSLPECAESFRSRTRNSHPNAGRRGPRRRLRSAWLFEQPQSRARPVHYIHRFD